MDVLSFFYATASILALSFDAGLVFQAILLWLADSEKVKEFQKKKKKSTATQIANLA